MKRATGRLALLLYSLACVVFLAGYAARYIHPKAAWWLQLFGIVLPYSAILIVGLSLPVFLSKRKRLRAVHVALLMLVLVRFPPWVVLGSGRADDADLSILTYNTPGVTTSPDRDVRLALGELAETLEPDFIALQEVYWRYAYGRKGISGRGDLFNLVMEGGYADAPDSVAGRIITHQPVVSVIPIERVEQHEFSEFEGEEDPLDVIKVASVWQDRPFTIYNIHLASYGPQKPWQEEEDRRLEPTVWRGYLRRYRRAILRRAWQAERVKELLEQDQGAYIVTGDFNTTSHNWSYRHIASGLRDAMRDAGAGTGLTYHRKRPIARIDFVLASRDFRFSSARVVDGHSSDHLAVFVTVGWKD